MKLYYTVLFASVLVSVLAVTMARIEGGPGPSSFSVSFIATAGLYLAFQAGRMSR